MSHFEDDEDTTSWLTSIDMLEMKPEWLRGFEIGVVYILMAHRTPVIAGNYCNLNQEQLFLMASQFGYKADWQPEHEGYTPMVFILKDDESD
jgi:hypothetical protein